MSLNTIFTLLFPSIFNPTSPPSLLTHSPYVYLPYVFHFYASLMLMTKQQGHNSIGIGTGLPTPDISCQTATQSTWLQSP